MVLESRKCLVKSVEQVKLKNLLLTEVIKWEVF
jgi:hypothetical protein